MVDWYYIFSILALEVYPLPKTIYNVDENNHFTSLGYCGRRFLCLGKRDYTHLGYFTM